MENIENIEIVDYHPSLKIFFGIINYEWLEKYFKVEPRDQEMLSNPEKFIFDKGGFILFAKMNGVVCGTVAMIKINNDVFEMAKMAVLENFRGKKIGEKLALEAIERAKNTGAKKIILDTNRSLEAAINLYNKLGFTKCKDVTGENRYERETFRMELEFIES
jgi:ribosomal protein S18 acetylase RimI-like enzyme